SAVIRVELVDNEDALSADDMAWVVVPPPEPLRVMLVTEGNYYLEKLLDTQPLEEPRIVTPAEYEQGVGNEFDLIIFDNYSPPTLPSAGTFVYSGGLPPAEATNVKPVVGEGDVQMWYQESEILDWERDHPMLVGLNLNRVWVQEGRLLTVPLGAEMLMEGVKGPFA